MILYVKKKKKRKTFMFLSTSGLGINVFFSGLLWQQPGLYQASTQHRSVWLTLKLPHNRPIFMGCSEQSRGSRTKLTEVHMCSCFTGTSVRRHLLWEKQQRKQRKKTGKNKKKSTKPKVTGEWWIGDKTETMLSLKKQSLWEKWQTPTAIFSLLIISLFKVEEPLSLNSRYSVS